MTARPDLGEVLAMPPGPERRAAMLAHPLRPNISLADFTPEERTELESGSSSDLEFTPIGDLYA